MCMRRGISEISPAVSNFAGEKMKTAKEYVKDLIESDGEVTARLTTNDA